jgi:hypothetical protein
MFRFLCWIKQKTSPDDFDQVVPHAKIIANPYYDKRNLEIINKSKIGDKVYLTYLCEDGKIISQDTIIKQNDRSVLMDQLGNQSKFKMDSVEEAEILEDEKTDDSGSIDLSFYSYFRNRGGPVEEEEEDEFRDRHGPTICCYTEDNRI